MKRNTEQDINKDLLVEDSEHRKMIGDIPNLGLQSLSTGKLIVKIGNNVLIQNGTSDLLLKGNTFISHLGKTFILSVETYMVTKSGISPQRMNGSLRNFKHKFKRYTLITTKNFVQIRARTRAQMAKTCGHTF